MSPLLGYFTFRISKTTVFGRNPVPMSLPLKRSNFVENHGMGVMSYRGLSDLHIIPQGQTVTSEYYVEVILKQSLTSSLLRTRDSGTILERKLLPERSQQFFNKMEPRNILPKEAKCG